MNKISMEELVNIVLTHSSKMTGMNKPASTPPRLLIIDRLALTSTKKRMNLVCLFVRIGLTHS